MSNKLLSRINRFGRLFKDDPPQSKRDYWSAVQSFWASVQSLAVVVALIVGGWWTYKTFSDLGSVNNSRAALENLELTNAKIRDEHPAINLEIDATQLSPPPGDKSLYISIVVTAKNTGTKFGIMCFEDPDPGLLTICPTVEQLKKDKVAQPEKDKYTDAEVKTLEGDIGKEQQQHGTGRLRRFLVPVYVARVSFVGTSEKLQFDEQQPVNLYREDPPGRVLRGLDMRPGQTDSGATLAKVSTPGIYRIAFSVLQPQEATPLSGALRPMWSVSKFLVVRDNKDLRNPTTERK